MFDPISAHIVKEAVAQSAKKTIKDVASKVGKKATEQALNHVAGQVDDVMDTQKENPSVHVAQKLTGEIAAGKLSDAATYARIEAAAHSANQFFHLPDIQLEESNCISVYRKCDIFLDNDVFNYNIDQFEDMGCTSFEDMTKIWSHECGHRILRMDYLDSWTQELGADVFSGVRSEMLGLPQSNFEELIGSTKGSATHPVGSLRVKAIEFGRQIVRDFAAQGIEPTIENCKAAFDQSPFSKITANTYTNPEYAAFVDDKAYHYKKAENAQEKATYYTEEAAKAAKRGDFSKAKDLESKAQSWQSTVKDEKRAADISSKLIDENEPITLDEPATASENKVSADNAAEIHSDQSNAELVNKPEAPKRVYRSFEEQTIDNDTMQEWRANPENNGKLIEGEEHNSTTLKMNLQIVTGEWPENASAHHLVGNETPEAAKKLEQFGIDRNSPENGINLPNCEESDCAGSLHTGRHIRSYYDEVERRFQFVTSKEEALEVLQSLKEDLYNGDLPLQYDVEPHKN